MAFGNVMIVGKKESFFIRILIQKLRAAGLDGFYVASNVNVINSNWDKADMVTYYLDSGEIIPDDVAMFLLDKLLDHDKKLVLVGDQQDTENARVSIPGEVYRVFSKPLDHDDFINSISTLFKKISSGEFKKSILVVDDDPTYLGLVREWLKDTYKISMANSGTQAIMWLSQNKPDLILLDFEMPVTNGPAVLAMIRSDETLKDIPVIFLTGKSDKDSVMQVVGLKPEGYLLKSISREELMERLHRFFTLKKLDL